MIKDRAKKVWGRDISDFEAQDLMNRGGGGDEGQVMRLIENDPTFRQQKLTAETRAREDAFTNKLGQIPTAISALETELGLPQARTTYQQAGQQVQNVAGQLRDIAPTQQTIAKQVGISAPRLQQRIGAETAKLQPAAETATRGMEAAELGLSSLLGTFDTRVGAIIKPFEIEAGVLGESVKNQFDLFKTQLQAETDRAIAELQERGANDRAALERATRLAENEQALSEGSFQDLGDRVALINPVTGKQITSFLKGLTPSRGKSGGDDGW